ncbi:hypothetical protein FH968_23260 [Buttiauxella sp. B2]|uniref:hypothetical protein n=1 Tax=Buttiauxella sp. B2 TaxID=2587812 RepID=UPI0011245F02|nr:hypothetical protein [Buttiauxella sp. B2]TNV09595.1 hypothetical protein FH968_23260 [Buttiauxella sp. B2]
MRITHSFTDTEISIMKDSFISIVKGITFVFLTISAVVIFFGTFYLIGKGGAWFQINHNQAFRISISVLTAVLLMIFWFMVFCISKTKDGTEENQKFCALCAVSGCSLLVLLGTFIAISCNIPTEMPTDLAITFCSLAIAAPCFFAGICWYFYFCE